MIITKLVGGHSNQLFQYAVGRKLAEIHNTDLLLDLTWYDQDAGMNTPRQYELNCYPLKAKVADMSTIEVSETEAKPSGIWSKINTRRASSTVQIFSEPSLHYNPKVLKLPNNTLLSGYWQNEKYFPGIRSQLLKELEPTTPLTKTNKGLVERMKASESVWMHVRRGDYVTSKHTNAFHGLKGTEYYQKAFKTLLQKLPKSRYKLIEIFICSNDIPWCKKNLKFDYPVHFVENKLGSDDMRVIKHCKHDIIANSSFSWWGAWLNNNPGKIVIAPKTWFEDKKANSETEIVPNSWIRI